MIGQITGQTKHQKSRLGTIAGQNQTVRQGLQERAKALHFLSRRGLWGIILFLLVSIAALLVRDWNLFLMLPANMQQLLGDPPPPALIHTALAVSTISALIILAGRMIGSGKPYYSWHNVGLPAAFYPLYLMADTGGNNFVIVFIIGMMLLLLEHFTVWRYARDKSQ